MYYPQEVALRGFAIGAALGAHSASRSGDDDVPTCAGATAA
jgi:hypothetical protein